MNEIVYSLLRKMVEQPCDWSYTRTSSGCLDIEFKEKRVLYIGKFPRVGGYICRDLNLTDKECRRIIRGLEHTEAMKIRGLT